MRVLLVIVVEIQITSMHREQLNVRGMSPLKEEPMVKSELKLSIHESLEYLDFQVFFSLLFGRKIRNTLKNQLLKQQATEIFFF